MSLRARLVAGMLVVSFVLVAVAFIIARTTEANLVDRVDQQLVQSAGQLPPGAPIGGTTSTSVGPTSIYAWRIQNGTIQLLQQPNVATDDWGGPRIRVERAIAAAHAGDA